MKFYLILLLSFFIGTTQPPRTMKYDVNQYHKIKKELKKHNQYKQLKKKIAMNSALSLRHVNDIESRVAKYFALKKANRNYTANVCISCLRKKRIISSKEEAVLKSFQKFYNQRKFKRAVNLIKSNKKTLKSDLGKIIIIIANTETDSNDQSSYGLVGAVVGAVAGAIGGGISGGVAGGVGGAAVGAAVTGPGAPAGAAVAGGLAGAWGVIGGAITGAIAGAAAGSSIEDSIKEENKEEKEEEKSEDSEVTTEDEGVIPRPDGADCQGFPM